MRDQNVYENAVRNAYDLGQKLNRIDKRFPRNTNKVLSEFKNNLDLLDDKDKKRVKNSIEKELKKRKKRLIEKNGSLYIEKITEIRISAKMMKRRLKRFA